MIKVVDRLTHGVLLFMFAYGTLGLATLLVDQQSEPDLKKWALFVSFFCFTSALPLAINLKHPNWTTTVLEALILGLLISFAYSMLFIEKIEDAIQWIEHPLEAWVTYDPHGLVAGITFAFGLIMGYFRLRSYTQQKRFWDGEA